MTLVRIELQVADRPASAFSLDAFHYGLIVQVRRRDGDRIRESVAFHALTGPDAGNADVPGVQRDRDRVEFERGSRSALDQRLVRRSAFIVDIDALAEAAGGSLQRVLAIARSSDADRQAADVRLVVDQRDEPGGASAPLQLLWATDEWRDIAMIGDLPDTGDMAACVAAIARLANPRDDRDAAFAATPATARCAQETAEPATDTLVREIERSLLARLAAVEKRLARLEHASAQSRPPVAPSTDVPSLTRLLTQVQHAADAVLMRGSVGDAVTLTLLAMRGLPTKLADSLRSHAIRIGAHTGLNDLADDYANVEFLSIVRSDGQGWLLPSNRANYSHPFSRYFDGDPRHWPGFVQPATCRIDDSGRVILIRKGFL